MPDRPALRIDGLHHDERRLVADDFKAFHIVVQRAELNVVVVVFNGLPPALAMPQSAVLIRNQCSTEHLAGRAAGRTVTVPSLSGRARVDQNWRPIGR